MNVIHQLYLALMAAHLHKAPITCPLNKLVKNFGFRATLRCNETRFVPLRQSLSRRLSGREPEGTRCTYTYSCKYDSPNVLRYSTMQCNQGNWNGTMPECPIRPDVTDEILQVFGQISNGDSTSSENANLNKASKESTSSASIALASSSARKSSQSKIKKLRNICDTQQMCTRLTNVNDCQLVVPQNINKSMQKKFRSFFTRLCKACFRLFCPKSVVLL